jgi:hypothetical protein
VPWLRSIAMLALLAPRAVAQPNAALASHPDPAPPAVSESVSSPAPWTLGIAPRLGLVAPTSKLGLTAIAGVQLDYALPALDHRLLIGVDVSLTRPSHDGSVMDPRLPGTADDTIHETELVIAPLASYRLADARSSLVPWVAAGPMLHLLRSTETTTIAPGDNSAVSSELGVELAGGVDYRVGPGFIAGDVRMAYSKLEHVLTGDTNAGKLAVALAYRLVF